MTVLNNLSDQTDPGKYLTHTVDYATDAFQRSVLFMDIMRKRGNIYFDHKKNNKPPVLTFDYDLILDGRSLERPVNFSNLSASRTGVMRMPLSRSTRTTGKIPWKKISRIPPNGPSLLSIPGPGTDQASAVPNGILKSAWH